MEDIASGMSWIGVVVGAIAAFLLGWLWYSPALFGPKWAEGVGVEMGMANEMPVGAMVSQAIGLLLLSGFVGAMVADNAISTLVIGTLAFAMLAYSGGMFRGNSAYARVTDLGYLVVSIVVMAAVQAII